MQSRCQYCTPKSGNTKSFLQFNTDVKIKTGLDIVLSIGQWQNKERFQHLIHLTLLFYTHLLYCVLSCCCCCYLADGRMGRALQPQLWQYLNPDWLTVLPGLQHPLWLGHGMSCKKTDSVSLASSKQVTCTVQSASFSCMWFLWQCLSQNPDTTEQ